jgi:hypothetical protein
MNMVRHQHPGPNFDTRGAGMLGKQVAVERIVRIGEEGPGASIAPLRHVVRQAREDGAGEASHTGEGLTGTRCCQLSALSPVIAERVSPVRAAVN